MARTSKRSATHKRRRKSSRRRRSRTYRAASDIMEVIREHITPPEYKVIVGQGRSQENFEYAVTSMILEEDNVFYDKYFETNWDVATRVTLDVDESWTVGVQWLDTGGAYGPGKGVKHPFFRLDVNVKRAGASQSTPPHDEIITQLFKTKLVKQRQFNVAVVQDSGKPNTHQVQVERFSVTFESKHIEEMLQTVQQTLETLHGESIKKFVHDFERSLNTSGASKAAKRRLQKSLTRVPGHDPSKP